jgi:ABC-type antimicrobial peptide transport system permease subunit
VRQLRPNAQLHSLLRLTDVAEATLIQEPVLAKFAGGFSVLALLLACIGLYRTVSYSVAQRTSEIGIRMALGARMPDVISMLMRETSWIVAVGVTAGCAAVLTTTKTISSLLFGLTPSDPATILAAALVVIAVTLVAAYVRLARQPSRSRDCLRHD